MTSQIGPMNGILGNGLTPGKTSSRLYCRAHAEGEMRGTIFRRCEQFSSECGSHATLLLLSAVYS